MAAVDREELVQARVLAEAGAEAERQARLAAELELERLGVGLEVGVGELLLDGWESCCWAPRKC